jgi:hypothetical protein
MSIKIKNGTLRDFSKHSIPFERVWKRLEWVGKVLKIKNIIMKQLTIISTLIIIITSCSIYKVKHNTYDTYFIKGRKYHYSTYCIDSIGDTLHKGKLVIVPNDRPWIAQPNLQESVNYYYTSEDKELKKKNIDPFIYYSKKSKDFYKENTGGYLGKDAFYIHPPRSDVFTLLFYSAHPTMLIQAFNPPKGKEDLIFNFEYNLRFFGRLYGGILYSKYKVQKTAKSTLLTIPDTMKVWKVTVDSKIKFNDTTKVKYTGLFNSTLDAEYCREYTYIKLHHTFENGVKIHFNFEKMTE